MLYRGWLCRVPSLPPTTGGPTAAVIAYKCLDIKVTVVDIDKARIAAWNSHHLPIYEPGLEELVLARRGRNLFYSTDVDSAIEQAEIIFVAVNTPAKMDGLGAGSASDVTYFEEAVRRIATVAQSPKILVEKSTVPCGTAAFMQEILDANSQNGITFDILSNPEFLAEGTAVNDLLNPDRILIGSLQTDEGLQAAQILKDVYARWVPEEKILTVQLWSSELSKLAANALLAQRVSSINSFSAICELVSANIDEVAKACGMDTRIGPNFLKASLGFGGSCFQKDILNLVYLGESLNLPEVAAYWKQVVLMNEHQKYRLYKRILIRFHNSVRNKKISILGFAFKKDTSDTRESPAITIAKCLLADHARLAIYDPKVSPETISSDIMRSTNGSVNPKLFEIAATPYAASENASAIIIATEWDMFKQLDYRQIYQSMNKPAFIFDGRLLLDHAELQKIGFQVESIGKDCSQIN
ncbi:UDP-glucose 6-dehydrogenase 1 [Rhizophlyctis rosea]|nr:UDP-glucose 6-dehydrogenase 1 [Rhizophlyctis rosea]